MRITRNPAQTVTDLIGALDNDDFAADEYFGCADNHRNFHKFDDIKSCSGECPQFQLGGAGYNSTSTSGNVHSGSSDYPCPATGCSLQLWYTVNLFDNKHFHRQNNDS